jgi:hypothetical protein
VTDIHLWRSAPGRLCAIVAIASARPQPPDHYKALLRQEGIDHLTIEVNPWDGPTPKGHPPPVDR